MVGDIIRNDVKTISPPNVVLGDLIIIRNDVKTISPPNVVLGDLTIGCDFNLGPKRFCF